MRGLVVNGFSGVGIRLFGEGSNVVAGNYLGTTADGASARGNAMGVLVDTSNANAIGGAAPSDRNVISGNSGDGVRVTGDLSSVTRQAEDNAVLGNYVGTTADGAAALGNTGDGVAIIHAFHTTVGGAAPGAGNVISGNDGSGVSVDTVSGLGSTDDAFTTIAGNRIGTDATGAKPLGNRYDGVFFGRYPGRALVGGREPGAGNRIAYNGGAAIEVHAPYGVRAYSNAIYGNELGIYYNGPAVAGPPAITAVDSGGGKIRVVGGVPARSFPQDVLVQFFANDACSGDAETAQGQRFLGEVALTTEADVAAPFDLTFDGSLPSSGGVTATTTDNTFLATSYFSECLPDTGGCVRPLVLRAPATIDVPSGQGATFEVEASGSEPLSYQWYRNDGNGHVVAIPGATSSTYTTPPLTEQTSYRVVVTNACGIDTAYTGASVCSGAPVIATQPHDAFVPIGMNAILTVDAGYDEYLAYQWYRGQAGDTSNPIVGATSTGVGVASTDAVQSVWVRVTNGCGSTDSATAVIGPGPTIASISIGTDASGKAQLVIKGEGFTDDATIFVGNSGFQAPAVVKHNRVITQKGKLGDGTSIKKAFPKGVEVTVGVANAGDNAYATSATYTRH